MQCWTRAQQKLRCLGHLDRLSLSSSILFTIAGTVTNLSVVPGVVVDINHTISTSAQAVRHQHVVVGKLGLIQDASHLVVREVLPTDRETEDIVAVIINKVLHLAQTIDTWWDIRVRSSPRYDISYRTIGRQEARPVRRRRYHLYHNRSLWNRSLHMTGT